MYCDIVLFENSTSLNSLTKNLGFDKLIFKNDFNKIGLVISSGAANDRKLIEANKVKILVDPHVNPLKDNFHFRSSGLDQVMCKLANKNNIAIGFSLSSLINPLLLGRMKQNIRLCRKYGVKMKFFTFAKNKYELRNREDLLGFLRAFGMTGKEAKESLSYF